MSFELCKEYAFEAAHCLEKHDGQCAHLHGHSYILRVHIKSPSLQSSGPKTNMVMDFADIDLVVRPMIKDFLDHRYLNDTLQENSPTAEFIARWIYLHLEPVLPDLYAVSLSETRSSWVRYSPFS